MCPWRGRKTDDDTKSDQSLNLHEANVAVISLPIKDFDGVVMGNSDSIIAQGTEIQWQHSKFTFRDKVTIARFGSQEQIFQ